MWSVADDTTPRPPWAGGGRGWLSNVLVGTALLAMVAAPIAYLVV